MGTAAANRWQRVGLALLGVVAAAYLLHAVARAVPARPSPEAEVAQKQRTRWYFSYQKCKECHEEKGKRPAELCECNEWVTWDAQDKHKIAFAVLQGPRGKRMGDILGYDVTKSPNCLSCHATVLPTEEQKEDDMLPSEGVSCVACHGAYKEWVQDHYPPAKKDLDIWRLSPSEAKETQSGMIDLWNPVTRARKCAECHIGDRKSGKFVTHAMYAAGHPPLPGFELATFSRAMPPHWALLRAKQKRQVTVKGKTFPLADLPAYQNAKGKLEEVEIVVVGAVVSLSESMKLLEEDAAEPQGKKRDEWSWPELAHFDCHACHHDLKSEGWRQKRAQAGKAPGRPSLRTWPTPLVRLAIEHAARGEPELATRLHAEYGKHLKALTDAVESQPFGKPGAVARAAGDLKRWADDLLPLVRQTREKPFDSAAAKSLLSELGTLYQKDWLDYDSARQVAWAYKVILDEVEHAEPTATKDAEVGKLYQQLNSQLRLDLVRGQKEIARDFLPGYLEAINNYNPAAFQQTFDSLTKKVREHSK
jgi:hypothetical protein